MSNAGKHSYKAVPGLSNMAHEEVKMPSPKYFISIKKDKINVDMELTKSAAKGKLSLNKAAKKKKHAGRNDDFI